MGSAEVTWMPLSNLLSELIVNIFKIARKASWRMLGKPLGVPFAA